jgi:endoglycosylceramidase
MRSCTPLNALAAVVLLSSTALGAEEGFVSVKEGRFIDSAGRQIIPHGINVGGKLKGENYVSWHTREDFAKMRRWGFNCVRLLIIWAAMEPNCGSYDGDHLRRIDERVAWAKANGLYVLIDMHQDLWGEKCSGGDGAPAWATLDQGRPDRRLGVVWSDGYLVSPMIQTAFDSFWANKPGPDGVGIQDRFALAWQYVARHFADEPAVIGYDLFNEPFVGSDMLIAQAIINSKLIEVFGLKNSPADALEFGKRLSDKSRRQDLFEKLQDLQAYRSILNAAGPIFQRFERAKLSPMYQKVAKAIRQVDKRHILFLEPSVSANQGFISELQGVLGPDNRPDALQAFCPHAYDIVTDMSDAGPANQDRIRLIIQNLQLASRRLGMPMLIGEWGALPHQPGSLPAARAMVMAMEETQAGDTYWYFDRNIERQSHFKMLRRPYPAAVAGSLQRFHLDPETGVFECRWLEDPTAKRPTLLYVPSLWYTGGYEVELNPAGQGHLFKPIGQEAHNGYLAIAPTGRTEERQLVIRPRK